MSIENENIECEYCNKQFATKSSLNVHKKTAKYCIEKQGIHIDDTNNKFICEYCDKNLVTKHRLTEHMHNCKLREQYEYENKLKEQEIIHSQEIEDKNVIIIEKDEYILKLEKIILNLQNKLFEGAFRPNISININETNDNQSKNETKMPKNISQQMDDILNTPSINKNAQPLLSTITLNDVAVTSRRPDHYINANELCQAGGKNFCDWITLDQTKEIISKLSNETHVKIVDDIWIHPDLAIQLAHWISPSFSLQISSWFRTLFNNESISIDLQLIKQQSDELTAKDKRIKHLEEICLSKRKRVEYPGSNVVYMLTTEDHVKRRTYIIGKAKNLTARLGTYNKTCDHVVVHYRECKSEKEMDMVESLVLTKLDKYREQANRDRFILPEGEEVEYFIKVVDECVAFLC